MEIKVKKIKVSENQLNRIVEIDKTFYDSELYTKQWYEKRYLNKPFTVLMVDGKIVGYYCFYTISKNLLDDILDLKYADDYYFPNGEIYVKSDINYLASVLVEKDFRKYSSVLLKSLLKDFSKTKKVVALAMSGAGERMSKRFMKLIGSPEKDEFVFYKNEK